MISDTYQSVKKWLSSHNLIDGYILQFRKWVEVKKNSIQQIYCNTASRRRERQRGYDERLLSNCYHFGY